MCGGFPGVNCGVCGAAYCPFCWLNNFYDRYPCISLCDGCYHNLKSRHSKAAGNVFLVKLEGEEKKRVVCGGRNLLKLFNKAGQNMVDVIDVQDMKHGLHVSI
jgi:hypothetical protein